MTTRRGPAAWAAFIWPGGFHHAAWRLPDGSSDRLMDLEVYKRVALAAERAKFDTVFLGDRLGPWPFAPEILARTSRGARLETITTAAALAAVTSQIGIVGTASTSFSDPYNIARQFGTIDHISGGRAGWNVVTSYSDDQAQNFGQEHLPPRAERYERAEEFLNLVQTLWDTYDEDAVVRDKATGQFFDPEKFHRTDVDGRFYSAHGALNLERPPQGYPVIAQAGASAEGMAFAGAYAELVFGASSNIERAQEFYRGIKDAAVAAGREPDDVKILTACNPVFGRTKAEAEDKFARMQELLDGDVARAFAENMIGLDLTRHDLDEAIPEIAEIEIANGMPSGSTKYILDHARDRGLTLGQFVREYTSTMIEPQGPKEAADRFEEWYEARACDGFMIQFSDVPEAAEGFVEYIAPELRKRGLLREEYVGTTLREHVGLAKPRSRHTAKTLV